MNELMRWFFWVENQKQTKLNEMHWWILCWQQKQDEIVWNWFAIGIAWVLLTVQLNSAIRFTEWIFCNAFVAAKVLWTNRLDAKRHIRLVSALVEYRFEVSACAIKTSNQMCCSLLCCICFYWNRYKSHGQRLEDVFEIMRW